MAQIDKIRTRVHEWTLAQFPLARQRNIEPTDLLLESGIIDSLGTLDVIMFLEEEFGFIVEEEEMLANHFESVESIADFVNSKISE